MSVQPTESNWFTASAPHSFTVARPSRTSKLSNVEGKVDKYRRVTFTGKLGVTEGSYPAGTKAKISIDYRPTGGSWTSTGTFDAAYGASFKASSSKKADSGAQWRLHIVNAGVDSASVKLGRKHTKIWNDGVSPEGVRKGSTLTAKGGLMQKSGSTWRPYAGQKIRVWFKAKTVGSAWKELGSTKTLSDGTFSKKFTAKQDGTWQMRYTDTVSTHYADYGTEDYVDVRYRVATAYEAASRNPSGGAAFAVGPATGSAKIDVPGAGHAHATQRHHHEAAHPHMGNRRPRRPPDPWDHVGPLHLATRTPVHCESTRTKRVQSWSWR